MLEVYGGMLTSRQKDVMELYYNYDLSLAEIAEQYNISRQGVHDLIKRGEQTLLNTDKRIGILEKRASLRKEFEEIEQDFDVIGKWWATEFQHAPQEIKNKPEELKTKILKLINSYV